VKTIETKFWKFFHEGSFSKTNAKISHKSSRSCDFRLSKLHNDYRSPEIHYQLLNWPSTGCLVSIFTVRINSVFPLGCTFRTREVKTQTQVFGNVCCPILRIKNNGTPHFVSRQKQTSYTEWFVKICTSLTIILFILLLANVILTFTFAICYRPFVCRLSVCRL